MDSEGDASSGVEAAGGGATVTRHEGRNEKTYRERFAYNLKRETVTGHNRHGRQKHSPCDDRSEREKSIAERPSDAWGGVVRSKG